MRRFLLLLILSLSGAVLAGAQPTVQANGLKEYREVRYVMGTLLDITLYHHDPEEGRKSLDGAFSLAQRLDDLLSNYKPESEVNRLNERAGTGKVRISQQLHDFLALAKVLSEKTQGAFDLTVGPLLDLWKNAYEQQRTPYADAIHAAKLLVGMRHITFYSNLEIEIAPKGVKIDTGGIGKGYAVDRIVELFESEKITSALINFGQSSIYALGAPPHASAWKLKLQFPGQTPLGTMELKNQALSASDSFGSRFAIAGSVYGHIVDPQTGVPITARRQAVVLSAAAAEAEALSKYAVLRGWGASDDAGWRGAVQVLCLSESGKIWRSEKFPLTRED